MDQVCVLLSTYNGETYIREQLDSLQSQQGVNLNVLIRDDGSKDSTVEILARYKDKWEAGKFDYYIGANKGSIKSFLELIHESPEADYYAFCDQDDVWDKDKLICAIEMLKKENKEIPCLYYSNLRITDENLKVVRLSHNKPHIQKNKYSSLIEPMATGCTVVFNAALMNLLRNSNPDSCSSHDTWVYMVCKMFGKTIYDFEPHINYRQHGANVVGAYFQNHSISAELEKVIRRIKKGKDIRYNNVLMLNSLFGDKLNAQDRIAVDKVLNYKKNIFSRLNLLFCLQIHANDWRREVMYRFCILMGIL